MSTDNIDMGRISRFASILAFASLIAACSTEQIQINLESALNSSEWTTNSSLTYDSTKISLSGSSLNLNTVDINNLNTGSHDGSQFASSQVSMRSGTVHSDLAVDQVLSSRASDLIGYWKFDGNFNDSIGSRNGTATNATVAGTPKLGSSSASFDGSGDYITLPSDPFANQAQMSVSVWTKFSSAANDTIIGPFGPGTNTSAVVYTAASGNLAAIIRTNVTSTTLNTTVSIQDDAWHHCVFTYDGVNAKLYVDGTEVATQAITGTIFDPSLAFEIGRYNSDNSRTPTGLMDEIAIWNTGLTASEVKTLYQAQSLNYTELSSNWTPHYSDLVGYWKMDGNLEDTTSNNRDGTAAGSTVSFATDGQVGSQAVSLPILSYIDVATVNVTAYTAISVAGWFRTVATHNNRRFVHPHHSGTQGLGTFIMSDGTVRAEIRDPSGASIASLRSGYNDGSWHHFAQVFDGTNLNLYINGRLNSTTASETFNFATASGVLTIAGNPTSIAGTRYEGDLDDIAVWSSALSATDVATIYNRQKQKFASSYTSPIHPIGSAATISSLTTSTELPFLKELPSSAENSVTDYTALSGDLSSGLVGYWPIDEITTGTVGGADVEDKSTNTNHCTQVNGGSLNEVGVLQASTLLDSGSTHYLNCGSDASLDNLGDQSISFWSKTTQSASTYRLLTKDTATMYVSVASNGRVTFRRDHATTNLDVKTDTGIYKHNEWNHIVVTWDGTTSSSGVFIYVNGVENSNLNTDGAGAPDDDSGGNFAIGGPNFSFPGYIDDVALWNRPLTAAEALQLYRRGANRVKYQVRACTDATCSTDPDWQGPGDGTTYFSELVNRAPADVTTSFNNCSTTGDNICSVGEFALAGTVLATDPSMSFSNYPIGVLSAQFFQYRVLMEAEDNTACSSSTCLPTLNSVDWGSTYYYGDSPTITANTALSISGGISSVSETSSGTCSITYQFSTDGATWQYWTGAAWAAATSAANSNTATAISSQLNSLTTWPSDLYFRAFLNSDGTQTCGLSKLTIGEL